MNAFLDAVFQAYYGPEQYSPPPIPKHWGPAEEAKHPRGKPGNRGQFTGKTTEAFYVDETPPTIVGNPPKTPDARLGWKLAEGRTDDVKVVEYMKRRAEKLGHLLKITPIHFANGGTRYRLTLYSRKGKKMKDPHTFYDMDAAGVAIMPDVYTMAERFADACCEVYARLGYRKKAAPSPGQKTFGFATPEVDVAREWGFDEELKHPRGPGGRWARKPTGGKQGLKHLPLLKSAIYDDAAKLFSKPHGSPRLPDKKKLRELVGMDLDEKTARGIMKKLGMDELTIEDAIHDMFVDPKTKKRSRRITTETFGYMAGNRNWTHKRESRVRDTMRQIPSNARVILFAKQNDPDRQRKIIVHPSTYEPGKWQVSIRDNDGPIGHGTAATREDAIRDAIGASKGAQGWGGSDYVLTWHDKSGRKAPFSLRASRATLELYTLVARQYYGPERYASLFNKGKVGLKAMQAVSRPKKVKPDPRQQGLFGPQRSKQEEAALRKAWVATGQTQYRDKSIPLPDGPVPLPGSIPKDRNMWTSYRGPKQGKGWIRIDTGEVRYQKKRPGNDEGAPTDPSQLKTFAGTRSVAPGMRSGKVAGLAPLTGAAPKPTGVKSKMQPKRKFRPAREPVEQIPSRRILTGDKLLDSVTDFQRTGKKKHWERINDTILDTLNKYAAKMNIPARRGKVATDGGTRTVTDNSLRDDIVMDALLNTYKAMKEAKFDPSKGTKFSSWLWGILNNSRRHALEGEFHSKQGGVKIQRASQIRGTGDDPFTFPDERLRPESGGMPEEDRDRFRKGLVQFRDQYTPSSLERRILDNVVFKGMLPDEKAFDALVKEQAETRGTKPWKERARLQKILADDSLTEDLALDLAIEHKTNPKAELAKLQKMWPKEETIDAIARERAAKYGKKATSERVILQRLKRKLIRAIRDHMKEWTEYGKPSPKKEGQYRYTLATFLAECEMYSALRSAMQPERYVFGQFDPTQHPRAPQGDPSGGGGRFVSKHGPAASGTQGVSLPKPTGAATKALGSAAPTLPKLPGALSMGKGLASMLKQRQPKPPKAQKAATPKRKVPPRTMTVGKDFEQALKKTREKRQAAEAKQQRQKRLREREKRLKLKEKRLMKDELARKTGASKSLQAFEDELKAKVKTPLEQSSAPKGGSVNGIEGKKASIVVPGHTDLPVQYKVIDVKDVRPSHSYLSGVARPTNQYPKGLQPREYKTGNENDAKVRQHAQEKRAGYYVSDHPDATNGAPVISGDGTVINGNGRAMSLQLSAATDDYGWYKDELIKKAGDFGIDADKVKQMDHPMLVRVASVAPDSDAAKEFARSGNVTTTQQESPTRTGASMAYLLDDKTLKNMEIPADSTLSSVLSKSNSPILRDIYKDMPASIRSTYFTKDRHLTDAGKEMITGMLLSKFLPVDTIDRMGTEHKSLKNAIETAIPQLISMTGNANIRSQLNEAIDFMLKTKGATTHEGVETVLSQPGLWKGAESKLSPAAHMLVDFFISSKNKSGGVNAKKVRSGLINLAQTLKDRGMSLLGAPDTEEWDDAAESLGVTPREGAKFGSPPKKEQFVMRAHGRAKLHMYVSMSNAYYGGLV